jgi:hypothetical protein
LGLVPLQADHMNSFGTVDAIDGTIAPGGGTASGMVANGADVGWIVFSATAGDTVTVEFGGGFGMGVGVIFREVTNGIVEVGDAANVSDFNGNHQGDGDDLVVETGTYGSPCPAYEFQCFAGTTTVTFTASGSGQYAIGFQASNQQDPSAGTGAFEATVSVTSPVSSGAAFAQPLGVISCNSAAVPPLVRAEGMSELVGNIVLTCTNTPPAAGGTLQSYVVVNFGDSLNVNISNNRGLGGNPNLTDAVLVVNDNHCTAPAAAGSTFGSCGAVDGSVQDPQFGVLAADNRLEWNQVAIPVPGGLRPGADSSQPCSDGDVCFPAVTTIRLASVRANASQLGVPSSATFPSTQITSWLSITGPTTLAVTNNVLNVAVPLPGLIVAGGEPIAGLQCVDGSSESTVTLTEGFATAFKTIGVPVFTPGQTQWESGYWAPGSNNGGGASQGTRLMLRFFNIPEGVVLAVPNTIELGDSGLSGDALSLAIVPSADANGAGGKASIGDSGSTEVSLAGGFGAAVYEVIDDNPIAVEQVAIAIGVEWEADTANELPAVGSGQVTASLAPLSTVTTSSAAAPEPRFAASTADPETIVSIARCTTTLLFPFVTNQSSFDTGFVISNTSEDWSLMNSEPQDGACALHYIGTTSGGGAAPPDQISSTVEAGGQLLWTLSGGNPVEGLAGGPDFQGYILAVCDFQYAHGFAFITNGYGAIPTIAHGYLALTIPNVPPSRVSGKPLDAAGHAHAFGETLSH